MEAQSPQTRGIRVRRIRPDDKTALASGLARLSDDSVHRRFLAPKPSFSRAELRYLTEVDGHDHLALVAFPEGSPDRILGVARYVRLPEDPTAAELAIVVDDEYQGQGIGSLLGRTLAAAARAHGIERFTALVAGENPAVRSLIASISNRMISERPVQGAQAVAAELAA